MGRQVGAPGLTTPCEGGLSHSATFLSAAAAGLGALPAVLHLAVFTAFLRAYIAHFRAGLADRSGELAAACHIGHREPANRGTVDVKLDAAGHRLDVFLAQA